MRATVIVLPVVAAVAACVAMQPLLARLQIPIGAQLAACLALAVAVVAGVEALGRRRLPVPLLLDLAVVFQDQAPAKMATALRSTSSRHLREAAASSDSERAIAASTVIDLTRLLTTHDRLTRGHSERVSAVSTMLADEIGITGDERNRLQWAALLHDVGKISVAPEILNKPGRPTDDEWAELRQHPASGAVIADDVAGWLGESALVIEQHHERYDGSGYPNGLRGEQISKAARIVTVADAYEVMTGTRTYQASMSPAQARAELAAGSGTHFDPAVVRAFASLSVARLHLALGPVAWMLALPFFF